MTRSEYAANAALQLGQQRAGWAAPSRCVRRKESAVKRVLRLLGVA